MKEFSYVKWRLFRIIKGTIYFIFFNVLAIIMFVALNSGTGELSPVIRNINEAYPAYLVAWGFVFSSFYALYNGIKSDKFDFIVFVPMFLYTLSTIIAYIDGEVPLIAIPFYLLICSLCLYDTLEGEFFVRKAIKESGWKIR